MPDSENGLSQVPKLGFFQRLKKRSLIKGITGGKYQQADPIFQTDPEVVEALMNRSPYNLRYLPKGVGLDYLAAHPEIIEKNPKNIRDMYLAEMPELFKHLSESQQIEMILVSRKYEFLKQLPPEKQKELLSGPTTHYVSVSKKDLWMIGGGGITFTAGSYGISSPDEQSGTLQVDPRFFYDKLHLFDEDIISEIVLKYSNDFNEKYRLSDNKEKNNAYFVARNFIEGITISNLPQETQLKLASIDNRLLSKLSPEALENFVGDNPLLLDFLPPNKKQSFITSHPELLAMLSSYEERKPYIGNPNFAKYIPTKYKSLRWTSYKGLDYDDVIKTAAGGYDSYFDLSYITDSVRNPDMLWEVSKTIPQALAITGITDRFTYFRKIDHVKQMLNQKIADSKIAEALERSNLFGYNLQYSQENLQKQLAVYKVLTDEKVLNRCNHDKIIEFIQNPNMQLLTDIVGETYGEQARKILESRPGLEFENIPNLRIFDEAIFENFGEGVIHNQLTYDTKFSILLADMANHPEKLQNYKKYERLTSGFFIENSAGNEAKYKAYLELADFISGLDEKEMTPERVKALKLVLSDKDFPETKLIPLKTIEDLDNYTQKRNEMYDEAAKKTTDPTKLKDIMSRRIFGMAYESRIEPNYTASTLSLNGMLHYYSIDNFLGDKRTYESDLFTPDELDMLELARIIDKIEDPKVLIQVYESLSGREDVLGPVEFEAIKQKIPEQYSKELVSQLLTPEKAHEMAQRGEQGISIDKGEDGVEVIRLHGADFKIMMNTMFGMNGYSGTNSGLKMPSGQTPDEIWKAFEQGCSTISTCLIEPNMLKSCAGNPSIINIGFCSLDPKLIIGMSHHDAHVSHMIGDPDPHFESPAVRMNYPEELIRKTAAQITGQESKDSTHEYNEVTSYRREQDPTKITSENHAGRIMPDYIVVYGKSNDYHRQLAKAFSKDGKPIPIIEIDTEAYYDRTYWRGYQKDEEHVMTDKKESPLVSDIKAVTEQSDDEPDR